jgi:hypothetical protein
MRKFISKIKDRIEDGLRRICAPMSPGTRILVIVILVAVFAVTNFYITFRAIYNIGREDKKWELIDSEINVPDIPLEHEYSDEEPEELQREMEEFFYEHFNTEKNDTTAKG